ncbi:hypothetical protein COB80_02615 [Candidatus Kaiserbacteria bacterium]|nr:MAG: hypothetical protein COB80_02615 [Candidatus Kaiserbacteria bacterium]
MGSQEEKPNKKKTRRTNILVSNIAKKVLKQANRVGASKSVTGSDTPELSYESFGVLWKDATRMQIRSVRLLKQVERIEVIVVAGFIILLVMVGTLIVTVFLERNNSYNDLLRETYNLQAQIEIISKSKNSNRNGSSEVIVFPLRY